MRFDQDTKLLSRIKTTANGTNLLIIILFVSLFSQHVVAQNSALRLAGKSLPDALQLIATQLKINIAFDVQKLKDINVSGDVTINNPQQILNDVLKNTGFGFLYKHNTYMIVKSEQTNEKLVVNNYKIIALISDRESGEFLPYVNVIIPDENTSLTASTGGTFSYKSSNNSIHLNINYLGYNTLDTMVSLRDSLVNCNFKLDKKNLMIKAVDVKAEKLTMISTGEDAGHLTINPTSFSNLPNIGETDVFRTLQLLPGISSSQNSADLNIRGGSGDQNLVLLDGFTLYNLDHFFGTFSFINPNVVKDIQIYRGGFDSRYGERVSGIIDITGKTGDQNKPVVFGSINLIDANLAVEVPVSKNFTLLMAGRRTYNNVYPTYLFSDLLKNQLSEPNLQIPPGAIQLTPKYYFYDFNTKASYKISDNEKISLSIYGGQDFLDNSNNSQYKDLLVNTIDKNQWANYGVSGSWMKQWNGSFFSNVQVGYSGYTNNYYNNTTITRDSQNTADSRFLPQPKNNFALQETNKLSDFSASIKNTFTLDSKNQIDFGLLARQNGYTYDKDADKQYQYNDLNQSAWLYNVFVQDKFSPINQLSIKAGLRCNYYTNTSQLYFEPRLSINYQANDLLLFKFATGRYYQYIDKVISDQGYGYNRDFWILTDNKTHPVLSSDHLIAGAGLNLKDFYIDFEAYYKVTKNIQQYLFISQYLQNSDFPQFFPGDPDHNPNLKPSTFTTGNGVAYGADLLVKYEKHFYTSWLSFSFTESVQKFADINQGAYIPAPYDQHFKLNWVNMFAVNKWNFSAVYSFSTGQPYITDTGMDGQFNTWRDYARLPNFNRVDVSVNRTFNFKKVEIKIGASIINVLNFKNYNDIYTRKFDFDNTSFGQTTLINAQPFTPNFSFQIQF